MNLKKISRKFQAIFNFDFTTFYTSVVDMLPIKIFSYEFVFTYEKTCELDFWFSESSAY